MAKRDRDQDEIWKDEADQLKDDLAKRKKVYKKREVPLQFGPNATKKSSPKSTNATPMGSDISDEVRRKALGLD